MGIQMPTKAEANAFGRSASDNANLYGNAVEQALSSEAQQLVYRVAYQPSTRPEPIQRLCAYILELERWRETHRD